jgi:hypothetical protein
MTDTNKYDKLLNALISGDISKADRYVLEKKALDDPMLFEAIEGLAAHKGAEHQSHIYSIHKKIQKGKERKLARRIILPVAIAASLLLLFTVGNTLLNKSSDITGKEETLVMNETESVDAAEMEAESPIANPPEEDIASNITSVPEEKIRDSEPLQKKSTTRKSTTSTDVAAAPPPVQEKVDIPNPVADQREVVTPLMADNSIKKDQLETDPRKTTKERPPLSDGGMLPISNSKSANSMAMGENIPTINKELNSFLLKRFNANYGSVAAKTELTFGIIFSKENIVQSVRLINGPAELGNQFIPFIKEYTLWKIDNLVLGKEYRYAFISE